MPLNKEALIDEREGSLVVKLLKFLTAAYKLAISNSNRAITFTFGLIPMEKATLLQFKVI